MVYFNPTDPNSARFNPLLEIRKGPRAIQDAMNIATILGARPQGKENPFWDGGGRDVLTATILYVMYTQKHKSLSQCITCLMNSEELFESMQMCDLKDKAVQAHLNDSATSFLEQDDKVKGGWVASAMGYLSLWKDPLVAATTSTSDFRLRDIQFARRPMSVFLVIPPGDLDRLSPLVRLFFQQLTDVLCEKLEEDEGEYRHRLLMMMDEFPQFGNMTKIEKALAYTAGYKIRWFIICQGLPQLAKTYGPHNEFLANSHLCLAYRANDPDNAESISKLVGNTTGHKEQEGESGKKSVIGSLNQKSVSQVEFKRELVTPDEAMTMESERILVMESGQYPIKAYRLTYYDDPFFIPRYKNKTWAFPSSPMKDFPSKDVIHDWGTHLPQSMPDVTENPSQNELYQKAVQGGEEPVSNTILKLEVQEIEELEIPVEMSGQQATRHLTTRSIRQEHIQALLEQGVRAGLIDPAQLDAFLGSFPQDDSPSTHESGSFSHEPEPSAPSPPCIEPPQERSVFTEPTTPDVNDVSPDVTSHDDNFLELNAFFDMMEDLPTESSSSLEHESTPARDTVVVEGLDERMANLRAEYEALTHSESTHNSEDQS